MFPRKFQEEGKIIQFNFFFFLNWNEVIIEISLFTLSALESVELMSKTIKMCQCLVTLSVAIDEGLIT